MFDEWKRKREAKKAKDQAIAEAQYWKNHPRLRVCLQAMRGSCTLASQALHEAAIAVVNIALMEAHGRPSSQFRKILWRTLPSWSGTMRSSRC